MKAVGCGSSGAKCDPWYPTNLGQHGFRHPIITWGKGTDAVPSQYSFLLSHLASWGFVVVASENVNTGTGQEILDARWSDHDRGPDQLPARYIASASRPAAPIPGT